jgi:hypothetical protein
MKILKSLTIFQSAFTHYSQNIHAHHHLVEQANIFDITAGADEAVGY